ncbi:MAG TPA: hypothetical protein VIW93_17380 [Candidatus Acidoferrum sp.]
MTKPSFVQPPRFAVWLVNLFTPYEQAESIPGDLLEEFSELALKSDGAFARRWYWRQSVKTIGHLIGCGFLSVPWRIAGAVLLGRLLLPFGFILPEKIIVAVLRVFPVYPNYDHKNVVALWMFWVPLAIDIGWVIAPIIIGCIVAVVAKGREMIATMTLGFTFLALRVVAIIVNRPGRILTRPDILLGLLAAFAIGGVIVRETRSALSRRPSPTHC